MRATWLWLAVAIAGCGDPLKSDVEMFCSAVVGTTWKSFVEVGPYVAERAKTEEFRAMLRESVRGGLTIWEIADRVQGWMKKTGVERCKTLEVIVRRRPPPDGG